MDSSFSRKIITGFFLILGLVTLITAIYQLRSLLMLFFLAFIFASALNGPVLRMAKAKVPRPLAIGLLYILILGLLSVLLGLALPPLIRQTALLLATFSKLLGISDYTLDQLTRLDVSSLAESFDQYVLKYQSIFGQLQDSITSIANLIFSTFSAVFVFFSLLITTFYFLMNMDHLAVSFAWLLPGSAEDQADRAREITKKIQNQLGSWVTGQLSLMLLVGLITFIGLTLLGVPFALPLALLAGLLEIVPNVGPVVAAVPSIIIAFFMMNPIMAGATLLFYILVQQFENNLIVPMIIKGAVDVRPLTTLILILMGFELLGVAGALLVVPFYITVRTFIRELKPNFGPFRDYTAHLPRSARRHE